MLIVALEILLFAMAFAVSLALRPWRMLHRQAAPGLITPMLATLAVLPFVWAVPFYAQVPFALSASGACLVVLMVGWPLAVPLLTAVGLIVWQLSALPLLEVLAMTVWLGLVPATLALVVGYALRRWLGPHPLAYVAGRAYFGTMLCSFAGALLAYAVHGRLPGLVPADSEVMAIWLLSVGEASVTAGIVVLLVACLPQALATWSDRLYLKPVARQARPAKRA
jgi:hypothetical protein